MDMKDFAPSKAERVGLAMKRITSTPDWKDSFGPLLEQELKVAQDDIAQADNVEQVWKGVGRLQAYRYIARAIEIMVSKAEQKQEQRLAKIAQYNNKGNKK